MFENKSLKLPTNLFVRNTLSTVCFREAANFFFFFMAVPLRPERPTLELNCSRNFAVGKKVVLSLISRPLTPPLFNGKKSNFSSTVSQGLQPVVKRTATFSGLSTKKKTFFADFLKTGKNRSQAMKADNPDPDPETVSFI